MRRALIVVLALVASACSGTAEPTTTTTVESDLRRSIAAEYAETAVRAFAGTRFEALGADGIMDLVLDACDRLPEVEPDRAVGDAIAAVAAPGGDTIDDDIAVEVVVEGLATVCPDDVLRASGIDPAAPPETDRATLFLGAVAPFADTAGFAFSDDDLLAAGAAVCADLESGRDPEAAILGGLGRLFDVQAGSLADAAGAGENEGLLLGAVLGAASVYFCPAHAERVAVFIQGGGFG